MSKLDELYDKVSKNYEDLLNALRKDSAENIIAQAYEFVTKGDILQAIEDCDECAFDDDVVEGLLRHDDPLDVIFEAWYSVESEYTNEICEAIRRAGRGDYRRCFVRKETANA